MKIYKQLNLHQIYQTQALLQTGSSKGWDGYHNGQPAAMDTYMYVLKIEFSDGTTFDKQGEVHLIR